MQINIRQHRKTQIILYNKRVPFFSLNLFFRFLYRQEKFQIIFIFFIFFFKFCYEGFKIDFSFFNFLKFLYGFTTIFIRFGSNALIGTFCREPQSLIFYASMICSFDFYIVLTQHRVKGTKFVRKGYKMNVISSYTLDVQKKYKEASCERKKKYDLPSELLPSVYLLARSTISLEQTIKCSCQRRRSIVCQRRFAFGLYIFKINIQLNYCTRSSPFSRFSCAYCFLCRHSDR